MKIYYFNLIYTASYYSPQSFLKIFYIKLLQRIHCLLLNCRCKNEKRLPSSSRGITYFYLIRDCIYPFKMQCFTFIFSIKDLVSVFSSSLNVNFSLVKFVFSKCLINVTVPFFFCICPKLTSCRSSVLCYYL